MGRKEKRYIRSLLVVIITTAAAFFVGNSLLPTGAIAASTTANIWIVGDSTVSGFTDNYYYPRYGWGTQIGNYLDGSFTIQNLALSGRSSKSYIADPEYQTLLSGMKSGDYLLVGFGHNDEKAEAERYTNPNGTYLDKGSFSNSLYENYIKPAQAAGCQVILCTPIVRRTSTGVWSKSDLHITAASGDYAGGDYSQAIRDLGTALNIPVVDMTSSTKSLYEDLGPDETLNLHAWTSSKSSSVDNTHTNIWGGKYNAYLITKRIKELGISGLAEHVIDAAAPTKSDSLVSNPNYKESSYTGELKQSTLWSDYGIWKGTVFGNVGGDPTLANEILETDSNGNMHISVSGNKGKIASTVDGLAMYYYKVPAKSTFELTANAKINKLDLNDQVSFGLMARDEMYIDYNTTAALGDYVSAAPLKLTKTGSVWNSFARKSGVLTQGGICKNSISVGDTVNLQIQSNSDGYACTFGNEATITGGFDFKLTSIDSDYVYVGMFVARNADITYSDIKLVVDGVEVTAVSEPAGSDSLEITKQPSSQTLSQGSTAEFSVEVKGTAPFKYQWQKDKINLSDDNRISGTSEGNLTIKDIVKDDAGEYDCIITDKIGNVTTSSAVKLAVEPGTNPSDPGTNPTEPGTNPSEPGTNPTDSDSLEITKQPSSQTLSKGSTAKFSVEVKGTAPFKYQWQKDKINLSDGNRISGASEGNLTIKDIVNDDTGEYNCIIIDKIGNVTTSSAVKLALKYKSSRSSSNTSNVVSDSVTVNTDEKSIQDAIKASNAKNIIINVNNTDQPNNTNQSPLLSQNIIIDLKANTNKTLVIKIGDASIEIKNKDGELQFTQNGVVVTGLKAIGQTEYYLDSNGIMQTGWVQTPGQSWYYFDKGTGVKKTNWMQDTNGKWYFLDQISGIMKKAWLKDTNGTWYYLSETSGQMQTGWVNDSGKWYYLYSNGSLALNTNIDGYAINENGEWIKNNY